MSASPVSPAPARLTRHRQAVLATVAAQPLHLTAADVYDAVRQHDPGIAYATVYNALHYLVAAGLIAEVRRPDGVVSYDRETAPHDHVICTRCGAIGDVWRTAAVDACHSAYADVAVQTGFTVEQHRVEFAGLCRSCRAGRDGN